MQRLLVLIIVVLAALLLFKAGSSWRGGLDEDQMMHFVYYAMLALLIGSGVWASHRNFGQVMRNIGLWLVIMLLLVTGYLYRNDAQQIASRVTAGLIPGRAVTGTDADGFSTVTLYRARNGHFQANVDIDGMTIPMLVDTGASTIALSYEDAERVGLDPASMNFTQTVMTANGPARTAYVTLPTVRIGGIERTNVRAGVAERGKLDQSLLGMNFLGSLSAFSFSGDELKLRD
jgi:aspartyl protease family protein